MPVNFINADINVKTWFVYMNGIIPAYKCWLCNQYAEEFGLGSHYKKQVSYPEGQIVLNEKAKNYEIIRTHFNSKFHETIKSKLVEKSLLNIKNKFIDAQIKAEENFAIYEATSKVFRTVYTLILANIPFDDYDHLIELQQTHEVKLGRLYLNRFGARKMITTMAVNMRLKLVDHLTKNNNPLSILVDTSEAGYHYLSVFFQTIENDRTVVYFYDLIQVTDLTGFGLYQSLYNQMQKDGVLSYVKNNLVGIATDGASSFVGKDKGFVSYFKKFATNRILIES